MFLVLNMYSGNCYKVFNNNEDIVVNSIEISKACPYFGIKWTTIKSNLEMQDYTSQAHTKGPSNHNIMVRCNILYGSLPVVLRENMQKRGGTTLPTQ